MPKRTGCHRKYFNPRSHERSDQNGIILQNTLCNFNPRSHERSDALGDNLWRRVPYFNPRSHERSDSGTGKKCYDHVISIHAPTRGATAQARDKCIQTMISIHAPTRGATLVLTSCRSSCFDFNPRSHERSDSFLIVQAPRFFISIHAPTRGATRSMA